MKSNEIIIIVVVLAAVIGLIWFKKNKKTGTATNGNFNGDSNEEWLQEKFTRDQIDTLYGYVTWCEKNGGDIVTVARYTESHINKEPNRPEIAISREQANEIIKRKVTFENIRNVNKWHWGWV